MPSPRVSWLPDCSWRRRSAAGKRIPLRPLCDLLFLCLLVIVGGSMAGQVAAITQSLESLLMSQWFGHQGYEYVELGRFWQWFLLAGLFIWLGLMLNAIHPALFKVRVASDDARG